MTLSEAELIEIESRATALDVTGFDGATRAWLSPSGSTNCCNE